MTERTYPADPAAAALRLFLGWFGAHYARSVSVPSAASDGAVLHAAVTVGRQWEVAVGVLNTVAPDATLAFEAARAAIEQRLDTEGRSIVLWVPRGASLPSGEPGLSQLVLAVEQADQLEADGRLEVRRPVNLYLRRTATTGSVVSVLGGLAAHWAQFTNRVPGSFQLNARELYRLPASAEEREALAERIVLAAGQPDVDDSQVVRAEDVWTANELHEGGSYVIGSPVMESDEASAQLRRNLRALLKKVEPGLRAQVAPKALVVLGAATYAEEEKLTWALRGMDPTLFAGYDILAVVADGVVKVVLEPPRQTLPWDAPPG
ncbi:MAG: hypothetical protein C0506_02530 [Anaerolinea sp.]|nr:hypothetical protein [Anaerolinea sp.]